MTTSQLRIAMISYYLPSESKIGVGYQVHALANELVARGHDVTVFSACNTPDNASYTTKTVRPMGSNRTFKFALAMRRVDWSEFDVLHAHGDDYWLWKRRVPVHIRTFHGSCLSEARWIKGTRERVRMLLLGLSELLASVVADEAVAVSANTRRWMPWVTTVIPNGIDLARFQPGARSQQPSILFVGTYEQRKRGKLLVDVFQREVLPALPECELWMVCGDAPSGANVKVLGRVDDDQLARLYETAWVFCLPSLYEGFGIPYIEAMAAGCPVVATPNPGAQEILQGGWLGALPTDAELGSTLIRLLEVPTERERLAERASKELRRYDLEEIAAMYEACYAK